MKLNQEHLKVLEELKKSDKEIEGLGFKLKNFKNLYRKEWLESEFNMEKEGDRPEIELVISRHQKYGTNIAINSFPFDEKYHFATGSPVSEEKALRLLKQYLYAIEEGRKYRGE